jgi:hypothetical protein
LTSPPVSNLGFVGILSGTLSGTQLSLTYVSSPEVVPGSAECALSGHGAAIIESSTMSGSLDVTFTACDGLNLEPPLSDHLAMTRQ